MDIIGVIQGLRPAPDDGEGSGDVGGPGGVGELHGVAVDQLAQELGVDRGHAAFDVELADETGLDDELGDVIHLDPGGNRKSWELEK